MKFFDPKEEVIDIQLTQEGKRLLAQGRFQPTYYAFFDDDILYDVRYASYDEEQNKSLGRIREDTPRLKVQYNRNGVESAFKKLRDQKLFVRDVSNEALDRSNIMIPMGTSTGNQYAPAWKIRLSEGEFVGPTQYYSASYGHSRIPQLSASVEVKTEVKFNELGIDQGSLGASDAGIPGRPLSDPDASRREQTLLSDLTPDIYDDGSYLVTSQPSILLDIAEINNQFDNENFEIEVFEIIEENFGTLDKTREILRPLWFADPVSFAATSPLDEDPQYADPNYSEHYVHVFVDGELDQDAMDKMFGKKAVGFSGESSPYGVTGMELNDDDMKEPC